MSKTKRLRAFRQWHRRAGLVSAVFVVLLSITGIMLNHTASLHLGQAKVKQAFLLAAYGQSRPPLRSYRASSMLSEASSTTAQPSAEVWLSLLDAYAFVNQNHQYQCPKHAVAFVALPAMWVLACEQEVVVFDQQFNILDVINPAFGLPGQIKFAGRCGDVFCASFILSSPSEKITDALSRPTKAQWLQLDVDQLQWQPSNKTASQVKQELPPSAISEGIFEQYSGASLSWERIVLDVHAGRFLGAIGPWLMDLMALVFIFLSASGIYIWLKQDFKQRKQKKKRHRNK